MKKVAAILFILGIPWLLIVVPIILSPIGILMPEYYYQPHDIISSILLSVCGLLGIAVLIGYRLRWKTDGFIWLSKKQFWTLSIIHHVAWILLIPYSLLHNSGDNFWKALIDFWLASGSIIYSVWIFLSLCVSIFALIYDKDANEIILAEQAAASNGDKRP